MPLETTATRFKAKTGYVDELVDALWSFDNKKSVSWRILAQEGNELVSINIYDTIEERSDNVV